MKPYKNREPSKHAIHFEGPSLTETEHQKSCDINHMIVSMLHGQDVRTAQNANYGVDDLTMTGLDFRIAKSRHEEELLRISKNQEFSQEELDSFPPEILEKYDFKLKKPPVKIEEPNPQPLNDELNDDKKAGNAPPNKTNGQTSAPPIKS